MLIIIIFLVGAAAIKGKFLVENEICQWKEEGVQRHYNVSIRNVRNEIATNRSVGVEIETHWNEVQTKEQTDNENGKQRDERKAKLFRHFQLQSTQIATRSVN